jgi:type II secretion system (T2SS) protein B
VSSILDALEKLESTGGPQPANDGGRGPGRGPWRTLLVVALAVVAGAAGAVLVLARRAPAPDVVAAVSTTLAPATTTVAPTTATSPPTTATVATTTATDAPTTSTAAPAAEAPTPPSATVVEARTAAPVPAPTVDDRERPWVEAKEVDAAVVSVPPPPTTVPRATSPPPTTVPREAAPARPSTAEEAIQSLKASRPPAGAPRLRVSFLVYSSSAERRSVALTIGEQLTTLHEGEESQGVQVVRIHPDKVELRWQGETFTLEVRG